MNQFCGFSWNIILKECPVACFGPVGMQGCSSFLKRARFALDGVLQPNTGESVTDDGKKRASPYTGHWVLHPNGQRAAHSGITGHLGVTFIEEA
ncbi:hypothetical protein RRG08_039281 [Elysia crispata]|uniref:Uncharacterized protein n=1 Tax=Elysia crispata TaxID=231223 RepID=A0AAE0Z798_9GAST|nr:hypothetical protein RRG08_039281 [Elysia crispata]